jgi:acyl-CoA thioester hydrolase
MEERDGVLLAVAKAECRFISPARYDDEVVVETSIVKAHPRLVTFRYRLKRADDGALLAAGETTHVFCDRALQPRKLPARYWSAFGIRQAS